MKEFAGRNLREISGRDVACRVSGDGEAPSLQDESFSLILICR